MLLKAETSKTTKEQADRPRNEPERPPRSTYVNKIFLEKHEILTRTQKSAPNSGRSARPLVDLHVPAFSNVEITPKKTSKLIIKKWVPDKKNRN